MKKWKFAIIGCGSIADFHLQALSEIEDAELVGVSSRREERAREVAEQAGCEWTTDYQELLNNPEVEIVNVTTSSGSHASIGMDVLRAGKHLLMEKPIAMSAADAEAMIRLAEEKNLTLAVVSQRRFEEHHQIVKRVLTEGKLGRLLYVDVACPFYRDQAYYDSADWRGTLAEDGGALMNQGIHSIDVMLWLAGPVQSVSGKVATQTHEMEAEDLGTALLTFENGALGSLMSSTSIQPGFNPHIHLYGEHGAIKIEGTDIVHWSVPNEPKPDLGETDSTGGGVTDPRAISTDNHKFQMEDLIEALNEGRAPLVTGQDGQRSVRLIEAIYESSKLKAEVAI